MTVEAFLEWEARQEAKWEFDGFRPVAMAGGTAAHSTIQTNLIAILWNGLRGRNCRVQGPDLKVRVAGRIRYPDAFVVCAPVDRAATVVDEPVVIFEVLSDGAQTTDRIEKNQEYQATPAVQRYVMLEQDRIAVTVFRRSGGEWVGSLLLEGSAVEMPELGLTVPLAEFYAGVEFPPPAEGGGR